MADMLSSIGDTIIDGLQAVLYATVYKFLYYLAISCCWLVDLLYSMFEIMAGLTKVSYDGDYDYLINVFFSNSTVTKVYWGMALIGLAIGFAFAIAAVIKKLFDINEKEKRNFGQILGGLFKSVLIILCMSLIITVVLNATTLLMQQISYIFVNANDLGNEESITFTDEEYATMARALNTIGNFSLNPSYNNRYNLNKCFNEIRLDLQYLKSQGVFNFHYVTTDVEGNTIATWQSVLQKIANSASLERDLSLDVYHESVSNSILQAMDLLKVNGSFKPLEEYRRHYTTTRSSVPMDRLLFLMATMRAAKNSDYNVNPSMTDPLRGAYYHGEKSIYDLNTVNEDFDIGVAAFDYLILFLACYKMVEMLVTIILNCVGRIFNMLLLYLISPIIVGVSPLDDGAKFKQWMTAFIVQNFSVFGTVISMRVLLLFMPLVVDAKLVLFANPIANLLTKLVIILGAFEVSEKATSLITGILADNAGWQSITAGDMSSTAKGVVAKGQQLGMGALKMGGGLGLSAAKLGGKAVGFGAKTGLKAAAGIGLGGAYGVYYGTKGAIAGGKALANKISAWRNSKKGGGAGEASNAGGTPNENAGGSTPPTGDNTNQTPPPNEHNPGTGNKDPVSSENTQSTPPTSNHNNDETTSTNGNNLKKETPPTNTSNTGNTQTKGNTGNTLTKGNTGNTQTKGNTGNNQTTGNTGNNQTTGNTGNTQTKGNTGNTLSNSNPKGNETNGQNSHKISPGIASKVAVFEGKNNPQSQNTQSSGPAKPLPQGVSPAIKDRVDALDAHFNGNRSGQVQTNPTLKAVPKSIRNSNNNHNNNGNP